jgi:hypothetical protein
VIYDPTDVNMCMNEAGVLFYRRAPLRDPKEVRQIGDETDWVELNEMMRNGEFRRPEW